MRLSWRRPRPDPGPAIQHAEQVAARAQLATLAETMRGRLERPSWDQPTDVIPTLTMGQSHRAPRHARAGR